MNRRTSWQSVSVYFTASIVGLFAIVPPIWLFISSISTSSQLMELPLKWIPREPTFFRYFAIMFEKGNGSAAIFRQSVFNSTIVAVIVTLVSVSAGSLAAYATSRMRFKGREEILFTMLFSYMLPPIIILIPLHVIMGKLGLIDSRLSLIIIYCALILPFAVWTLRGFFNTIPSDLEDAARIDGCSRLGAFFRVMLPLSLPGLSATSLLCFILSWEEFLIALVFTSSPASKTIPVAIAEFTHRYQIDYGFMAAGGVIAAIIPVVLSLVFQKGLITGLTAGAVKE